MIPLIACGIVAMLICALFSDRLRRWYITGPVAMVVCGIAVGFLFIESIAEELDTDLAERIVELILAILLFVDATEVRGGYLGGQRSLVARLLGIALPVSLVLAVLIGIPMLGASSLAVVIAIALVVIPPDFAPAAGFLRDPRIPRRLRNALAVESGYADALRAPIFAFALVVIEAPDTEHNILELANHALPDIGFAIVVGLAVGAVTGYLARVSLRRGWVRSEGIRIAVVLIPIVTYAAAVVVHGNGFVAAFIAGITYRLVRLRHQRGESPREMQAREEEFHTQLTVLDDLGVLTSLLMWFVFGSVASLIFLSDIEWMWLLFGLIALLPLRSIPVQLSLLGSRLRYRERAALGFMGPRGTSTIMFGLLAFNAMDVDDALIVLYVMVVTVLASVVIHGLFGTIISRAIVGQKVIGPPV